MFKESAFLLVLFFSLQATASVFDFKKLPPENELISQYQKKLIEMKKDVCEAGDENKYESLLRDYRQNGFYIPFNLKEEVEIDAIQSHLHLIKKKIVWINDEIKKLEKSKFPHYSVIARPIEKRVVSLLDFKKKNRFSVSKKQKTNIKKLSEKELRVLKKELKVLFSQISFLLNPYFPVSHQEMRENFEKYKTQKGEDAKKNANSLFFQRKIYEDGTYDEHHKRSDLFLRTTLDTLALEIEKESGFLSENTRFDIEWTLKNIKTILNRGKKDQLARLKRWKEQTEEAYSFYEDLIKPQSQSKLKQIARERVHATENLKSFVLNKLKSVYEYWHQTDEVYRALFISDLILLHEVGRPTQNNLQERQDIAQVILNRKESQKYSKIMETDVLFPFLKKIFKRKSESPAPWLDVLFKEGEFSFTYYFIPSVSHIFCPEVHKTAAKMREKNLSVALDQMKNPDWDFKALRYFSRISMVGKVDMALLWGGEYEALPERPGRLIKLSSLQRKKLKKNDFQYYYSFQTQNGQSYDVINLLGRTYSVLNIEKTPLVYQYKDPQYFRFFTVQKLTAQK